MSNKTRNIFNKEKVTVGYYLINGIPTISGNNRYSDYIPVTPGGLVRGTVFITSDGGAFYDKKLKFISKITADNQTKITVPSNAYYMRINISSAVNLDTLMVNDGPDLLPFEPYADGIEPTTNSLIGKKILTVGDSITWLDKEHVTGQGTLIGYQEQFRKFSDVVINQGNSGATYRQYVPGISDMNHGSIYNDIVTNNFDVSPYDIITLFGGTNDIGRGLNLGTVGSIEDTEFDPKTTLGALRGIIEYIRANNPDCEIYIMTPIRSGLATRPYDKMEQLADGIKGVSYMYGIPCIDLLREGGIGKGNYSVYLYDDLHPNNKGFELIGKRMVRYINAK